MSTAPNTVQILIQATDTSAPVLQNVDAKIAALGGTAGAAAPKLQLLKGGLAEAGTAGAAATGEFDALRTAIIANTAALGAFNSQLPHANAGLGKTRGNMRLVSGEARELGIHLGYSMRAFLAENPAVIAGLHAMEGVFVGMAAIDIAGQAIEGLHALYEKFIDVEHAVDEYRKKAGEAAEQKLFDTSSIETTLALLDQVKEELAAIQAKKDDRLGDSLMHAAFGPAAPVAAWGAQKVGLHSPMFTGQDAEVQVKDLQNQATAQQRLRDQTHEEATEQIEARERYNSTALQGLAKIAAAQQVANEKAAENFRFTQQNEQALHDTAEAVRAIQVKQHVSPDLLVNVPKVDPNAGWQKYVDESTAAARQAAAERLVMARQETEQEIRMRNDAIEAGMRGEALYEQQRDAAEDAIRRKIKDGAIDRQVGQQQIDDIDMKAHNAKMVRLEEEQYQTAKIEQTAQGAGLTGIARTQFEGDSRVSDLTDNPQKRDSFIDQSDFQRQRGALERQTDAEVLAARQQFSEELAEIVGRSDQQQTAGYARIEAETDRMLDAIAKKYEKTFGQLDFTNPADLSVMLSGLEKVQQAIDSVQENSARERQKYTEETDRQISQTEAEAARALMPPWQAAQEKILDDYQLRLAKIREDVQEHVITEQQGAREVQAAWALATSEMERQEQESRDRLAGQLSSFFDNPAKYMQQRAKQLMFDIMANWMQQVEQTSPRLQGAIGAMFGMNPVGTGSPQHALGQLFGIHQPGAPSRTGMAGAGGSSSLVSAGSTLTAAGSTLSSSGTMLTSSAMALSQAATMWESALYNAGGPGGSAGAGAGGDDDSDWTDGSGGAGGGNLGSGSFWLGGSSTAPGGLFGGSGASPSFGGGAGGGVGALSETLGIPPQLASMIPGAQGISSTLGLVKGFSNLLSSSNSGGAQLLNASGGFQPSDINQAPTNSAGVLGTVPDGGASSDDSGSGGPGVLGGIGAIAAGGMTAFGGLSQAWNSSNIGSGLIGAGETALGGAEIGTAFMPGIGTAIGAAVGFGLGLAADIFGDHGRSKAQHYNTMTVVPTLQQLMDSFGSGGGDYDQASMGINNLQIQAQKQTAQWGSGAVDFYHGTIVPEITNAQDQVQREGAAGRANVTTTAAQFHYGGWVDDFLDLATSNSEGFIHARQGEYMMHNAAASTNAPWLEAMNRGLNLTTALRPMLAPGAVPRETGAAANYVSAARGGSGMGRAADGAVHKHEWHFHGGDAVGIRRWLRGGGAMEIQTELNRNAARYSGKALSGN